MNKNQKGCFNKAVEYFLDENYKEANIILNSLIKPYEEEIIGISFSSIMERLIYQKVVLGSKSYNALNEPVHLYFYYLSYISYKLGKYQKAYLYIYKGLMYCPISSDLMWLKAYICYQLNDFEQEKEALYFAIEYAYTKKQLGKAYQLFAEYMERSGKWEIACLSYTLVTRYLGESTEIINKINHFAQIHEIKPRTNPQEIIDLFNEEGLYYGPSILVTNILISNLETIKVNDHELYSYLMKTGYELTNNSFFKEEMKGIDNEKE